MHSIKFLFALFAAALGAVCAPAIAAPPLEAYGSLPDVERFAISPDGSRMATVTTIQGERIMLAFNDEGKALLRLNVGDQKIRSVEFANDDLLLVVRSVTEKLGAGFVQDKVEFYQAILVPLDGGDVDVVFGRDRSLLTAVFGNHGIRTVDGRPKAYFGAIELVKQTGSRTDYVFDHGRPALYEVDLLTNRHRKVDSSPQAGESRDWLIDADGGVLARFDISENEGKWKIGTSSGKEIASGRNAEGNAYLVAAGKDGTSVIYGETGAQNDANEWYEVRVDGSGKPVPFLPEIDVRRLYLDQDNGRIIGYLRDDGDRQPVFFDPTHTKRAQSIRSAFAKLNRRMVDWTANLDKVVVRTDGNGDSGTYYVVDLGTKRANAVAFERTRIDPSDLGSISTVAYKAADGLELDGILTLPPNRQARDLPLVMLPHGGPHSRDEESFDWWAQAFASRGYAVFQPNFRGSTNRDEAFVRAGYGEWGRKMQTDLSDGLKHLADEGIIDPARVCIVGASYGGYAALAGVTLQQGLYRCAVSVAGVSDLSMMSRIERRESGDSRTRRRSLTEQLGPSSRFREVSPRHHAERADAPILLIHGRDDTVVHYQHSTRMADALKDAGKPYEFVELDGEDHWLSLPETRLAMLKATVAFVEKHNPAH